MFQRFPDHFQQQPMLRVQKLRFSRRDSEEIAIEAVHIRKETSRFRPALNRCFSATERKNSLPLNGQFNDGIAPIQ
jgi:hypothetical protein